MAVFTDGVVTHAGRVLSVDRREQRVMSDVYADVTHATVVLDDGTVNAVYVKAHFECDQRHAYAVVDATPEVRALADARGHLNGATNRVDGAAALVAKLATPAKPAVPVLPGFSRGDLVMVTGKVAGLTKGDLVTLDWAGRSKFSGADRVAVLVNGSRVYFPGTKVTRVASTDELAVADDRAATETARAVTKREVDRVTAAADLMNAEMALVTAKADYEAALAAVAPGMAVAA